MDILKSGGFVPDPDSCGIIDTFLAPEFLFHYDSVVLLPARRHTQRHMQRFERYDPSSRCYRGYEPDKSAPSSIFQERWVSCGACYFLLLIRLRSSWQKDLAVCRLGCAGGGRRSSHLQGERIQCVISRYS